MLVACGAIACRGTATPTAPTPVAAVIPAALDLPSSLSSAFDAFAIPANHACSLSVSRYGQVVLERGRGELPSGIPASADSRYRIASLTKPITASAVLVSEKAGRLNRTDKINRFLTYPEPAPTFDELIKHVPGLPDYVMTPEYQNRGTSATSLEALLSLIQPWDGIRRYQYSNSHAILSGSALQQANKLQYEEVVQRDIFGPAGMTQSSFTPPGSEPFPFPATHPSWVYSAAGITSTAPDLNRFNQALMSNLFGFGAPESFERGLPYTSFGMNWSSANGELRFAHNGFVDGYTSITVFHPGDRSSIVMLCNFPSSGLLNFVLGPNGIRSIMLGAK